jgi:predicted enzyme related to lactoylglutathione lyase
MSQNSGKKKIAGLRTAIYHVKDIDAAKKWYAKAFETAPYFDEPFYVGFNVDGFELGLQPQEKSGNKTESVVAYWATENVEVEFDRLLKLGAKENESPLNVGGDIVVASVKDPWDNIIGLIYNPHFK